MARRLDNEVGAAFGQLLHRLDGIAGDGVDGRVGAEALGDVAPQRHGIDDDHPRAHADRGGGGDEADGAAAGDDDGLGRVGAAVAQHARSSRR